LGSLNEKQTELLIGAREDSERLVEIIDDLLDLNRIESNRKHLTPQPCSPHSLARDGMEPFLVEARDKGIGLTNAVDSNLPDVLADSARIRHVFANLLSNALRCTRPGGSITVRADLEPAFVRFFVEDTGVGIPSEHIIRVFEPFFRVPGQDEKTGVGLGLAIVKEIARVHGGDVGVESTEGKGTHFWFTLTRADAGESNVTGSGHGSRKD
jgi:signal transduction histidine kinase